MEGNFKGTYSGCPLYVGMDACLVGACSVDTHSLFVEKRKAADMAFQISGYSHWLCVWYFLLHVLSDLLYHEFHRTCEGGGSRILQLYAGDLLLLLLFSRVDISKGFALVEKKRLQTG